MKTTLSPSLRDYILKNKIPSVFIDFDEFYHNEMYDGRSLPKDYQALILRKPEPIAFEIETFINWPYSANKVLLMHHSPSKEIAVIPLSFSYKPIGKDKEFEFDFSLYHSIEIDEGYIMITTNGHTAVKNDSSSCLNIAIFTQKGDLVSVWESWNVSHYKSRVMNFHQLNSDHWIVNLEINEGEKNKPAVPRLYLLSVHSIEAYILCSQEKQHSDTGLLLRAKTGEIKFWFSLEIVEGEPEFLVIASSYQCCVYHYKGGHYTKHIDVVLDSSLFGNLKVSFLKNEMRISSTTNDGKGIWNYNLLH